MNESLKRNSISDSWKINKPLKRKKDVQNIDLMNLAGFCRNCCQGGTEKRQGKMELRYQIQMQENIFMECLILSGRKYQK